MNSLWPAFAVSAALSLILTPVVRRLAHRLGALDRPGDRHPGDRQLHSTSIPRLGGVAIAAAWLGALGVVFAASEEADGWWRDLPLTPILVGAGILFSVGLWDDLRPVAASRKLMAQTLAAAAVAGGGIVIERVTVAGTTWPLGWLSVAATLVWILTITNAFNLIDGLDGLAPGLAVIAGAACTAIVVLRGEYPTAIILMSLLGALVGFLPFNFNPATIFLGDSGSLLIGFVLAVTAITGFQKGATALATGIPLLVFAIPLVDSCGAIVRRVVRAGGPRGGSRVFGEVMRPDQQHIHHYLMSRGLSHRATVLLLYAVAICLSGVALATIERP